jgi:type 2 lantibiotic biosynthesis protein LanM
MVLMMDRRAGLLRRMSFHAANLYERFAAIGADVPPSTIDPAVDAALRAWNQAFAPGSVEAFEQRLTWDGLSRDRVAALVSSSAASGMPIAEWTVWIDRASVAARALAAQVRDGAWVPDPGLVSVPFEEVWTPFRNAAREALVASLDPAVFADVDASVLPAFERQLVVELARQGELAVFEHFRAALADRADAGDRYRAYIGDVLNGGLDAIVTSYPVLARQLASVSGDWVAATRDWFVRLHADRPAIAAAFTAGVDAGPVTAVDLALSDPHHGRQRVHAVEWASGLRLVYKPRSVALERVFGELLEWLNRGLDAPLPALLVLDRGAYGWVEFARHEPLPDRAAVAQYYRRSGALMCLTWVLRAKDLHMENVVATAAGPVLIDLEMLLQPIGRAAERVTEAVGELHAPALIEESGLSTGLLSLIDITAAGDAQDSGGLRGQRRGQLPFARRAWKAIGTADLHYVEEPTFAAPGRHEVMLDGVAQQPDAFADDLTAGFADACRLLLDRRDELLPPDGLLARFAACETRVLPRPTNQYAMLSFVLAAPKYQRDAAARTAAMDVLHRGFAGSSSRPDLWQVAVEERRALDRLDVPYFSVPCDGTDATCEGRLVARGYFSRSGLEAAAARLRALSPRDLDIQLALISRAARESVQSCYGAPVDGGDDVWQSAAVWIGRELLARAVSSGAHLAWPYRLSLAPGWSDWHLYDGALGPALFFSALAAVDSDPAWTRAAQGALGPLRRAIRQGGLDDLPASENIGGLSGLGSIVYGLTVSGALLKDRAWIDLGAEVARALAPRIAGDTCLDVVDGAAGAALALLALHATTGDASFLRLAADCGERLLQAEIPLAPGPGAWRSADGQTLVGFAHGAAGIVHALSRLAAATEDARFEEAARRGTFFVDSQFLAARQNYALAAPAAGAPGAAGRVMTAWCHGAPGVVLGLASAVDGLDICEKAAILSKFDAAVRTTARADVLQPDHLCCGTLGRAEVLLTVGRVMGRTELVEAAGALAADVVARAQQRAHFRLSGPGSEYRVFDPGFFRGMSGIGYEMLRLAAPAVVPSVARLDPPDEAARPG